MIETTVGAPSNDDTILVASARMSMIKSLSPERVDMLYFGPYDRAGHHFTGPEGSYVSNRVAEKFCPWKAHDIDCGLQPGCRANHTPGNQPQGAAALHHKDGWTALAIWDRSVDSRLSSNSTFLAEGTFNFDQMVKLCEHHFAQRWARIGPVKLSMS